jgi:hypothetical protein
MPRAGKGRSTGALRSLPGLGGDMNVQVMYLAAKSLAGWVRSRKWSREDRRDAGEAADLIAELIEENEGAV